MLQRGEGDSEEQLLHVIAEEQLLHGRYLVFKVQTLAAREDPCVRACMRSRALIQKGRLLFCVNTNVTLQT